MPNPLTTTTTPSCNEAKMSLVKKKEDYYY